MIDATVHRRGLYATRDHVRDLGFLVFRFRAFPYGLPLNRHVICFDSDVRRFLLRVGRNFLLLHLNCLRINCVVSFVGRQLRRQSRHDRRPFTQVGGADAEAVNPSNEATRNGLQVGNETNLVNYVGDLDRLPFYLSRVEALARRLCEGSGQPFF